ncbi:MAG: mucoidy inhibitor MuiA family protein, partial [Saprospiraceae bacterium]|nr:mucoidy inhibitor MuiA family protein [Saprospiraceae bacterium]
VYLQGAQIERTATFTIPKGKTNLVLTNLSPFLDPASISVQGKGNFITLSVNHRRNYLEKESRSAEVARLLDLSELTQDSITLEQSLLTVWAEEEQFLRENRNIKGEATGYQLEDLQAIGAYYTERIRTIKKEQLAANKRIQALNERLQKINQQRNELQGAQDFGWSEIVIQVQAENQTPATFEISYLAGNASWFPSYDLWVNNVEENIQLVYQANLRQDTKEDWENVQLAFSNAEPSLSGQAPSLYPYFLSFQNYYQPNPVVQGYVNPNRNFTRIQGRVTDTNGEPLIGATIRVSGSTIGTVTNFDGSYELSLPQDASTIEISYVGFTTQVLGIGYSPQMDVALSEGGMLLDEVVINGYSGKRKKADMAPMGLGAEDAYNYEIPTQTVEFSTSVEFQLDIPYTAKSGNETLKLDLQRLDIPADYNYTTVPKLDETAYLLASITDWEQYNLLEGELSLHFEDTYVGKSILDVRYATDTLLLSLGRDKGISIERERVKDFSKKTFLGGKIVESRFYRITIRNTKKQAVNIEVRDQIPLSTTKEILVESLEISGGTLDPETGEIVWKLEIPAGKTIVLDNKYQVKYPKGEYIRID